MSLLQIAMVLVSIASTLGIIVTLVSLLILVFDDYKSIKRKNEENKSDEER